jgi:hypothetical protein
MCVRKDGRGKCSMKKSGGNSIKQPVNAWRESSPELKWRIEMPGKERLPW